MTTSSRSSSLSYHYQRGDQYLCSQLAREGCCFVSKSCSLKCPFYPSLITFSALPATLHQKYLRVGYMHLLVSAFDPR